jgi:polar amino acid transport system substrate-binding protein
MRLLLLLLFASGCAAPAPITALSDLDNRPFAWVDEDGTPRGRDVEMMTLLAARVGRPLEWRREPFERLLPLVEAGEADVVCATLGVTPERAERVLFTEPYFHTEIAVVVRAGDGEPRSLAELGGKRVSGAAGTTSERAVRTKLLYAVGVFENKTGGATDQRLLGGEIDAAVMDGPAADAMVAASGGHLLRLAQTLDGEHYALALPKDRAKLARALDCALGELDRSGALAALNAAYGLD